MTTRAAPRKPAAKPARADTASIAPVVVEESVADASLPDLKRQELLAQVVERSEVKKKFAKPVLDAALAVIGEALAGGRELNLAPMGKVKINRTRQMANGRVIVARIRQNETRETGADAAGDKDAKEGVADPSE
jgi:DNA-binding protein HU-alpha